MTQNAIASSTQSSVLSPEEQASLLTLFPNSKDMSPAQQQEFFKKIEIYGNNTLKDLSQDNNEWAEKVLQKALEDGKKQEEFDQQKQLYKANNEQEIEQLKRKMAEMDRQLWIKNQELTSAKRKLNQAEKDIDATTQIEFGPVNLIKLALIKRQQKKLDYFMKEDPEAGMRYAYYNGMFGVRHLKRALHKKWWIKEDPEKVKKKFEAYIGELKDKADTPKKQAIVRRLAEHAKIVNDKYVDIHDRRRKWPKKFNSAA